MVSFFAFIGFVYADNVFNDLWTYKYPNILKITAEQVLDTDDAFLVYDELRLFWFDKDGYNYIYESDIELVYDAIDSENKIVTLIYSEEDRETYLVFFDDEGNELSRENVDTYGGLSGLLK